MYAFVIYTDQSYEAFEIPDRLEGNWWIPASVPAFEDRPGYNILLNPMGIKALIPITEAVYTQALKHQALPFPIAHYHQHPPQAEEQSETPPTTELLTEAGMDDRARAIKWACDILTEGFVLFDLESTGLEQSARICEIAILDHTGEPLYNTTINPEIPIQNSHIHGITDADVKDSPTFAEAWSVIRPLLEGKRWVLYNKEFDVNLLRREVNRIKGVWLEEGERATCAMLAYAAYRGEPDKRRRGYKWHKLTDAVSHEGIEVAGAHSSLGDCLMTLQLIQRMESASA